MGSAKGDWFCMNSNLKAQLWCVFFDARWVLNLHNGLLCRAAKHTSGALAVFTALSQQWYWETLNFSHICGEHYRFQRGDKDGLDSITTPRHLCWKQLHAHHSWTSACWLEAVHDFLITLCLCTQLLLYLLNCLSLDPCVFSLLPSQFSSPSYWGASEYLCGAELPTGVKPHLPSSDIVSCSIWMLRYRVLWTLT